MIQPSPQTARREQPPPPINERQEDEITFSKQDYDDWMNRMNERKFNHYLAWFNVNIKQANTLSAEDVSQEPPHDYRIKATIQEPPTSNSAIDRLKLTAHRRQQQIEQPGAAIVAPPQPEVEPEVIKIGKKGDMGTIIESSTRMIPPLHTIVKSSFNNKKRNRQEFEEADAGIIQYQEEDGLNQSANVVPQMPQQRGYKKLKANDGTAQSRPY